MDKEQNVMTYEQVTVNDLESQIKNNQFNSKDQLVEYLVNLRNKGLSQLDNQQMQELLNLFDSLHKKEDTPLDMQNYSSVGLENQDLITSKENDRVLKTLQGTSAFSDEFRQTQNEIIANNQDGMVNADTVFEHMATHEKEEMSLISLTEAISRDDIQIEVLNKIKFFITNSYVNPYSFKVDLASGIFYNVETDEVYEVRKNVDTNQYEIYRGSEKVYGNNTAENEQEVTNDMDPEKMAYESTLNKPMVRVRKPEDHRRYTGNAAFTKVGLLVINIITFALLITMIVLLNK